MNYLVVKKEYNYNMGRTKILTDEERREKKLNNYHLVQKPKDAAEYKRLESVRCEDGNWKTLTKVERREFKTEIREINQKRFDTILNDDETWERINSSSDEWMERTARKERRKRNGNYVNDKEVQRAVDIIYGGMTGSIIEEEIEDKYENPYDENQ